MDTTNFDMILIHLIKQFRSPIFVKKKDNIWLFDEFVFWQMLVCYPYECICSIEFVLFRQFELYASKKSKVDF